MAGFMDSVSKGITTINMKTSNFMEENKLKTEITTKEQEIEKLKSVIGNTVYENRAAFDFSLVAGYVDEITTKKEAIERLKSEIVELSKREQEVLGTQANIPEAVNVPAEETIYCGACGSANKKGFKFCVKCGGRLDG